VSKLVKSMNRVTSANQVMDSTKIIPCFFFQHHVLFNYLIIKLNDRKISHQPNTMENKTKSITKLNSKLTQHQRI
jgi:hypothetical protein